MNGGIVSDWYNSLKQELEENKSTIEAISRRSEYWRKSNLDIAHGNASDTTEKDIGELEGIYLYKPDLTIIGDTMQVLNGKKCQVFNTMDMICDENSFVKDYYGKLEALSQRAIPRPLARDNTIGANTGFVLNFLASLSEPFVVHNKTSAKVRTCLQRNIIVIDENVEATLLETGNNLSVSNSVTEIYLKKNAKLNYFDLTGLNNIYPKISHKFCDLAEGSSFSHFGLKLNTRATRSEIELHLNGPDIATSIANVSLMNKKNHSSDENVLINHNAHDCKSRQVFKSVLDNDCTSIVRGKIYVAPVAQKTDGYQSSRSLLLNESSKFFCKPELEIYADDVACSHGSTSSSLDKESLFYLLSRGVCKNKAREMLVVAFITEALNEIENESIKATLAQYIGEWISSFFHE